MRFKVGQKVRVVKPHYGCYFYEGDVVEIARIGTVDGKDMNCYGGRYEDSLFLWYLHEDEVEAIESEDKAAPLTNGDKIRAMSNRELAEFLFNSDYEESACEVCPHRYTDDCAMKKDACIAGYKAWLNSEAEDKEND